MSDPTSTSTPCAPVAERSQWFASEIQAHDSQLRAYLRGSFPSVRDVDDVVQESYLRVWTAATAQPIQSAKAFLFTVARNIALKVVRKNRNAPFVYFRDLAGLRVYDNGAAGAGAVCAQEKIELLADAVMTLPPRCREIVIMHKLQGQPQRKVAEMLGLSERTVETQVRIGVKRCLAFLRERGVTRYYDDEG